MKYSTAIKYEKSFSGQFKNLAKVSEFIRKAAERAGFNEIEVYELQLAVDEAFSNIIEHAYEGEGIGDIDCICFDSDGKITITLHDWGKSFDPESISPPDFSVSIEDLDSNGAGLIMMHKIMDELEFKFTEDDGNYLIMTKHK